MALRSGCERVGREARVVEDDRLGFAAEELEGQAVGREAESGTKRKAGRVRYC